MPDRPGHEQEFQWGGAPRPGLEGVADFIPDLGKALPDFVPFSDMPSIGLEALRSLFAGLTPKEGIVPAFVGSQTEAVQRLLPFFSPQRFHSALPGTGLAFGAGMGNEESLKLGWETLFGGGATDQAGVGQPPVPARTYSGSDPFGLQTPMHLATPPGFQPAGDGGELGGAAVVPSYPRYAGPQTDLQALRESALTGTISVDLLRSANKERQGLNAEYKALFSVMEALKAEQEDALPLTTADHARMGEIARRLADITATILRAQELRDDAVKQTRALTAAELLQAQKLKAAELRRQQQLADVGLERQQQLADVGLRRQQTLADIDLRRQQTLADADRRRAQELKLNVMGPMLQNIFKQQATDLEFRRSEQERIREEQEVEATRRQAAELIPQLFPDLNISEDVLAQGIDPSILRLLISLAQFRAQAKAQQQGARGGISAIRFGI